MSKRAPDECTREGGKEKESKRKADKDKLHPLVPLSTWIRAEPVLAAADDIIVRSTTGEGGVSGIWSHPGNKCTCACPCKVQSDGFTTGRESSCDSNIQHRFISSHFLSLSCHPSVSTHFIILSFLDWLLFYCLQLHLCSLNSHFHAFLSFFPSSSHPFVLLFPFPSFFIPFLPSCPPSLYSFLSLFLPSRLHPSIRMTSFISSSVTPPFLSPFSFIFSPVSSFIPFLPPDSYTFLLFLVIFVYLYQTATSFFIIRSVHPPSSPPPLLPPSLLPFFLPFLSLSLLLPSFLPSFLLFLSTSVQSLLLVVVFQVKRVEGPPH